MEKVFGKKHITQEEFFKHQAGMFVELRRFVHQSKDFERSKSQESVAAIATVEEGRKPEPSPEKEPFEKPANPTEEKPASGMTRENTAQTDTGDYCYNLHV